MVVWWRFMVPIAFVSTQTRLQLVLRLPLASVSPLMIAAPGLCVQPPMDSRLQEL